MRRIAIALLLAGCASTSAAPPVAAPPKEIRILPGRVLLEQGESLRFHAVDGEGNPVAVRWSVVQGTSEGPPTYDAGSVTADGLYRPGIPGYWNHVRADAVAAPGVSTMALLQVVPAGGLPVAPDVRTRAASFEGAFVQEPWGRVFHPPGAEQDADRVARWTTEALELLRNKFRSEVPERAWHEGTITIGLQGRNGPFLPGDSETSTSWADDRFSVRIAFVAPTLHDGTGSTSAELPYNEVWYRMVLVKALAPVALEAATRLKRGGGWRIHDAPQWFVDGLTERLAITLTMRDGGRSKLATLRSEARSSSGRALDLDGTLRLADPRVDGTVFVDFLGDRSMFPPRDWIGALLLSTRPDFDGAIAEVFGAPPVELLPAFRAWLAKE